MDQKWSDLRHRERSAITPLCRSKMSYEVYRSEDVWWGWRGVEAVCVCLKPEGGTAYRETYGISPVEANRGDQENEPVES